MSQDGFSSEHTQYGAVSQKSLGDLSLLHILLLLGVLSASNIEPICVLIVVMSHDLSSKTFNTTTATTAKSEQQNPNTLK